MKKTDKIFDQVYNECHEEYDKNGTSAVIDHINTQQEIDNVMYKDVKYLYCKGCMAEQPTLLNVCLVCGSVL